MASFKYLKISTLFWNPYSLTHFGRMDKTQWWPQGVSVAVMRHASAVRGEVDCLFFVFFLSLKKTNFTIYTHNHIIICFNTTYKRVQ